MKSIYSFSMLPISAHHLARAPKAATSLCEVSFCFLSCELPVVQAQVGDIGLMGGPAKLDGKAVEGVRLFRGGIIGENPTLATEFEKGVPCEESILLPKLRELLIEHHGAKLKEG